MVAVTRLQEAAILVKDVVDLVARQALKCGIGVDQDIVVTFLLGYHDTVVGGFDYQLQQLGVDHQGVSCAFHGILEQLPEGWHTAFCSEAVLLSGRNHWPPNSWPRKRCSRNGGTTRYDVAAVG